MIKSVFTQFAMKSLSVLFAICLMSSGILSQNPPIITYNCMVVDTFPNGEQIPSGVVQFRLTAKSDNQSDEFTLENIVNMYSYIDPDIFIADGFMLPEIADSPDNNGKYVFQVIGYTYDGILPYAKLYHNGMPMPIELEFVSCLSPLTTLTGDMNLCLGRTAELTLSVSNPNLIPDSTKWSTPGLVIDSMSYGPDNLQFRVEFGEPGDHLVSVTGKTTNGFTFSDNAIVTVTDVAEDFEIMGDNYICTMQADDHVYTINNPDSVALTWSSNPPASMITPLSGSGSSVEVDFPAVAGFYVLSVENADPMGCIVDNVDYLVELVDVIDTISILGERYVCLGDSAVYSLGADYSNVVWSVTPGTPPGMGGFDLRPGDGMADEVEILFFEPGTYDVMVSGTIDDSMNACPFESVITVRVPDDNVPQIACNNSVNVALDENCSLELTADMILEGDFDDNDAYELIVVDAATGDTLMGDILTQDLLGNTFIVTVTQKCGGNSCWGTLIAEDKTITQLEPFCPDMTSTTCYELHDNNFPVGFPNFDPDVTWVYRPDSEDWLVSGFDNCSDVILSYTDESSSDVCADPQLVVRTWTAVDINNGLSTSCSVDIFVALIDQSSISWPPHWDSGLNVDADGDPDTDNTFNSLDACDFVNPPELMCGPSWQAFLDENGNPSPECTGSPIGLLCANLQLIGYKDQEIPICGEGRKILRKWTVWDSCAEEEVQYTQIITLMDLRPPVCTVPPSRELYPALHSCENDIEVDLPIVTQECSSWTYTMRYKTETVQGNNPSGYTTYNTTYNPTTRKYTIHDLPFDSDYLWVEFVVIDDCGNRAEPCYMDYELVDNEQPIPACDFNTAVALNNNGEAHAGPETFDDSSWDNCGIYQKVIRRMNYTCGCYERHLDFLYKLGEYDGHYYYLSREKFIGRSAFKMAEALDGYVAVIDSSAENTWIRDRVSTITSDAYYIGLRGEALNTLEWAKDSDYNYGLEWGAGEPNIGQDEKGDVFVVVEEDGSWNAGRQTEFYTYYVVEFEEECGWTQKVHFCCDDVKEETMVAMKAIDFEGNHNFCMVNVNVQDFIPPVIECPAPDTINCDHPIDLNDLSEFGTAQGFDDCEVFVTELPPNYNVNACQRGTLVRNFEARDKYGNRQTCSQIIYIINEVPFTEDFLTWPEDEEVSTPCSLENYDPGNNVPDWNRDLFPCSNITYTHDDLLFDNVEGACQKLVRTWTVVDWCQPSIEWNHIQVIKLKNTKGPTITTESCASITVSDGIPIEPCRVQVDGIVAELVDDPDVCSDDPEWWYEIDYNSDGSINASGTGNDASGGYPYGVHTLRWYVRDDCDNVTTCTKEITVLDNLPPTPYCHGQIVIPVNAISGVEIWASDLDLGSWDNCPDHPVYLSFEENTIITNLTLSCDDLQDSMSSSVLAVDLWVWDNTNSSIANKSYCTVNIIIQDNQNLCGNGGSGMIAGIVMTENFEMIEQVEVNLNSSVSQLQSNMMSEDGEYAFEDVQMYNDYSVKAFKDDGYLNGVSTLDLVLIQRHVLGVENLGSPYKMIAADINNSQDISAIDLIELRKLILGIYDELPHNDSWRFVESAYQFIDPLNPWPFSEEVSFNSFDHTVMDANFYGVKIGDVDDSATLESFNGGSERMLDMTFDIALTTSITEKGNTRLQLISKSEGMIAGTQFALRFNPDQASMIAAIPMELNIENANIAWQALEQGQLLVSWNDKDYIDLEKGDVLMEFLFSGDQVGHSLAVANDGLNAEIYSDENNHITSNSINFTKAVNQSDDVFTVYQNIPNPFNESTVIGFTIPDKGNVTISISDAAGKLIHRMEKEYDGGYNEIIIDSNVLNTSGILYYKVSTATHTATKKMIVLR